MLVEGLGNALMAPRPGPAGGGTQGAKAANLAAEIRLGGVQFTPHWTGGLLSYAKWMERGQRMPKLTIQDVGEFDVEHGTRLVNALEDNGGEPLHRCGGNARCTTCRVEFTQGEPSKMTKAEKAKLESQGNLGKFRLSCQSLVEEDMQVRVLLPLSKSGLDSPGERPKDSITPEPEWTSP